MAVHNTTLNDVQLQVERRAHFKALQLQVSESGFQFRLPPYGTVRVRHDKLSTMLPRSGAWQMCGALVK